MALPSASTASNSRTVPTNTNANGTNNLASDGQQINKGVELNVFGEPLDGLRVLAGATWMNPS